MTLPGKSLLWLLALCLLPLAGWGQKTGILRGTVTDAESKETLPNVGVTLVGTYLNAVTDFDGQFQIPGVPAGDYSVKVQVLGYGTQILHGIRVEAGKIKTLTVKLSSSVDVLQTVTVLGQRAQVDLESAKSERSITGDDIAQMNVRSVEEVVSLQAGVAKTNDGIQIRGARVYETEYLVDGISAQDPLAGTGFGVRVQSSAIQSVKVTTGGASAEYGGGSSGVISTRIREGGDRLEISGRYLRDYLGSVQPATSFNTDQAEVNISFPLPGTKNKVTVFNSGTMDITDDYFPTVATQLYSSLFPADPVQWSPRQSNSWTHTAKMGWQVRSGTKLTLTNQHSLNIN